MKCEIGQDIERAARLLQDGELVSFGTETVYGLGAHALDELAVAKIFEAKGRPTFDPLIVHVADQSWLKKLVQDVPPQANLLAEKFWPGPLTIVMPKREIVPDLVTAGLANVGIRIPAHPVTRELLEKAQIPIAAPSANLFGQMSPTRAEHVADQLGERISYILDAGPCQVGLESSVVSVVGDEVTLLRPGGVPLEALQEVVGPVQVAQPTSQPKEPGEDRLAQTAPGMLSRHYAPRTKLVIVEQLPEVKSLPDNEKVGLLSFGPVEAPGGYSAVEVLSENSDLTEAAAGFFSALRRLDASGVSVIVSKRFPQKGLGRALNDRLQRASVR